MIETFDLTKYFDDFRAVEGVTLKVEPGQILALLGQNGAGKTTTVRMLTAILSPTRGGARVNGFDVVKQAEKVRAVVGVLTEQHGLYPRMSGEEYLDFFGQAYRLAPAARAERSRYLLEYFGIAEVAKKRIGEYSKGMKQKLALARALMHKPPVLLLDEPTSAMDPESARLVRDEIARLKSSQRTIVICTHNLVEAEALADVIAIIYRGRILLSGALETLKDHILGPAEYEVQLSRPWQVEGLQLPPGVEMTHFNGSRLRFRTKRPQETNPELLRQLAAVQAPIVTLQEVPRTLEQVYLKAMAQVQDLPQQAVLQEG